MSLNFRQMAMDFMNKQAGVKVMSPLEFSAGVIEAEEEFRKLYLDSQVAPVPELACDPKTAIKDRTITCVCCGQQFKVLSKKHLLSHEHTPSTYRKFCGYKKGTPLVSKALQRERRNRMRELRLWEREGSGAQKNKDKKVLETILEISTAENTGSDVLQTLK